MILPPRNHVPTLPRAAPKTSDQVGNIIDDVLRPARFFVGKRLDLDCQPDVTETLRWEVYRGRLLDPEMTRQERAFQSWQVWSTEAGIRSGVPLLAVMWDHDAGSLHVVRGLHCYAWEASSRGGNVIEGTETKRWRRELLGTIRLDEFTDTGALHDELGSMLFHAVVGTSRLPLTSIEAPLPDFSFGQLFYLGPRGGADANSPNPLRSSSALLDCLTVDLPELWKIKLFETWLHALEPQQMSTAAAHFAQQWRRGGHDERDLPSLLHGLFREISLSPYTDLVDRVLSLVRCLEEQRSLAPEQTADFLTFLLRLSARHLTAYDLVVFHNQGANYPDALMVDAVLKELLGHVARHPDLYLSGTTAGELLERSRRLRRRGLRQGSLLRRHYEALHVPDLPTSQGENARVLPESHPRVPAEQITRPQSRQRRLFHDDPLDELLDGLARKALQQSFADLEHPDELRELGMALILDRPLGVAKDPFEPDATPLLSYEAFSRTIAERRLQELCERIGWLDRHAYDQLMERLRSLPVAGVTLTSIPALNRPVPISLDDARKVTEDFILLRTTPWSARRFLELFDIAPLRDQMELDVLGRTVLIVRDTPGLAIHDDQGRKRIRLALRAENGYRSRAGVEFPASGLEVLPAGP